MVTRPNPWPDERWSPFNDGPVDLSSPTWCSLKWFRTSSYLNPGTLAFHFKWSADTIIDHRDCPTPSFEYPRHADGLFMPVGYLYRHALELRLKHLVFLACAAEMIEYSRRLERLLRSTHKLDKLWKHAKEAILAAWPDEERGVIENTEALILDLHKIDGTGQNLRYTKDGEENPTHVNYPDAVDLKDFRRAFDGVFNSLEGCGLAFEQMVEWRLEANQEMEWCDDD